MRVAAFLVLALIPLAGRAQDADVLKRALPRLPPTAAADGVKTFRLAKGFRIELVASEPHVVSPVDLAFDEDGRLWVVEMIDYPYDEREGLPPEGRIRVLEDDDGDGRFERSFIFAEQLRWPTGLCLWDGGVFVASAPDILYLKDTDGDHKADRKEIVFTGFRRNNVQALVSNLRWGLDNWFTGSSGQDGGQVWSLRKPDQAAVSVEGRHFRFRPTGEIEALSGDGRYSNTSDDFGRRFCSATSSPVRHVVLEDRYLRRNPHLPVSAVVHAAAAEGSAGPVYPASAPEPWRVLGTAYFMSGRAESVIGSIERGGAVTGYFTGATGPLIYRGTALGEGCYGQYFIGECGMNLVHRRTLVPVGSTFRADRVEEESEFLTSTDNWFRPVSLANGPDGALYIVDMYRETIEHPWSIPPALKSHLDLRSGRDRGRIWRVTAEGAPQYQRPRLGRANTAELVAALERPDAWWRETAARLLYERQDKSAVGRLERLVADAKQPTTRAAALWALQGLGALRPEVAEAALEDTSSGVREQAVCLARIETLLDFDDSDARVRMELAFRMGETGDPRATDVLARLAKGADVWLRTAIVSSSRTRAVDLLRRLADDEIASLIAITIGARNDEREIANISELARDSSTILSGLGNGLKRANQSLASVPALAPVLDDAERAALDDSKPVARRIEAVRVLSYGSFEAAKRRLPRLFDARVPAPVRLAAFRSLVTFPDREVGALLLEHWPTLDAEAQRESLAWFRPADRQALLLQAIEKERVSPADIGADLRRALLANKSLAERAEKLLGSAGAGDRRAVIQTYRPALGKKGNVAAGREVYRKNCLNCHRIGDEGHDVGPNLASIRTKSPEEIMDQILDPNRLVEPQYFAYQILTTDGRTFDGVLDSASETTVTLRGAEGATETVLRANIERIFCSGVSLMPEGLEKTIDKKQMADLIAFLRSP
ncbi:MAG: PVC-type heme-binding CxxCH protein [Pirellulales bacterium]